MSNTRIYWLHTLSPTHVGTGRGLGYIDLPIHRDKITNWPMIPGSAFKGVWADKFKATKANRDLCKQLALAFGKSSDTDPNVSNAGALVPTDARLVCMPVRSFKGTFAWCASPLSLQLLQRDLILAGVRNLPDVPQIQDESIAHCTQTSQLRDNGRIYLEELDFQCEPLADVHRWAEQLADWVFPGDDEIKWREMFISRFTVVSDVVFDFLSETGTEINARVRIDEELKTVANGALWNEESLPAEAILSGLITCDKVFAKDAEGITESKLLMDYASKTQLLQIGGKATVGRGRVRCVFTPVAGASQ